GVGETSRGKAGGPAALRLAFDVVGLKRGDAERGDEGSQGLEEGLLALAGRKPLLEMRDEQWAEAAKLPLAEAEGDGARKRRPGGRAAEVRGLSQVDERELQVPRERVQSPKTLAAALREACLVRRPCAAPRCRLLRCFGGARCSLA